MEGPKSITFARNHDIDRGQSNDHGLSPGGRQTFGVGQNEDTHYLDRIDVHLAYAYMFGTEVKAGVRNTTLHFKEL